MKMSRILLLLAFLIASVHEGSAATIYVNAAAGGANTGADWANAYTSLQSALAAASSGDEIWIAAGLYKPTVQVDVDGSGGSDPREVTFQIPSGVALYGGFAGGELLLTDRDWTVNLTILSGDIDNNDVNLDGNGIAETSADIVGNNAYHVVYTQSVSATTRVDGIVITAGEAGDFVGGGSFTPNRSGGGWYNQENPPADVSSPQIYHCRFSGNFSERSGGGFYIGSFTAGTYAAHIVDTEFSGNESVRNGGAMYLLGDESLIETCTFIGNDVTIISDGSTDPGSAGAASMVGSSAIFDRCLFRENSATGNPTGPYEGGGGGAVSVTSGSSVTNSVGPSHVQFFNSAFVDNHVMGNGAAWGGAAVHRSDGGVLRISYTNCVFHVNTASHDGGAIANFARALDNPMGMTASIEPEFTNCTFYNNVANRGGAIYYDESFAITPPMMNARLENSILHTNAAITSGPQIFISNNAANTISYSLIQGSGGSGGGWSASIGADGGNNIDANPQFVSVADTDGPDGILGTMDDGLAITGISPAVNTGNNAAAGLAGVTEDITGAARIQATTVDMGAYESPFAMNPCGAIPAGLTSADIGNTGGYAGTVCYDMGTYEVDASGSDIWGTKDGFHFVYRQMIGNGEIVARVDDIGYNDFWDLAGVMMRADLSPKSKNVLMAVNAGGQAFMQRRLYTGWFTGIRLGGSGGTPQWVKLVRYGNFFAGFKSTNGSFWTWVGTYYVPMPYKLYVGIATSTPLAGTPDQYTISNLSIDGIAYKNEPFDITKLTEVPDLDGPREQRVVQAEPVFNIYPNPAEGRAQVDFVSEVQDHVQIQLMDMQGRVIRQLYAGEVAERELHSFELDGDELPGGVYLLKVAGESQQQVLKWVLTR
jgi:hypothetical protein